MKIAILITLYIIGIILTGAYFYKRYKTKSFTKNVDETDLFFITLLSIMFPISYLLSFIMITIKIIGEKQCKDQ